MGALPQSNANLCQVKNKVGWEPSSHHKQLQQWECSSLCSTSEGKQVTDLLFACIVTLLCQSIGQYSFVKMLIPVSMASI
jgi:hypothetical protein